MRLLSILRHAKAAAGSATEGDHDRPLASRGVRHSLGLGADLARMGLVPDQILCSDARRTAETVRYLLAGAGVSRRVLLLPEIYEAGMGQVLDVISECGDPAAGHVMVVGHNPTVHMLAEQLAAASATIGPVFERFSPGTNAVFEIGKEGWSGLRPDNVRLAHTFEPGMDG